MVSIISQVFRESIIFILIIGGLILVHEFGHMLAGYLLGIPKNRMSIQIINREKQKNPISSLIFSISPHIALLDNNNNKFSPSPNEMENYIETLEYYIPSEKKMFWFVAGGHVFEFIIILSIAIISIISNNDLIMKTSFRITHMAIILTTIYLIIDLFSAFKSKELTGGDFSGQWALSPAKTITFYIIYFTGLIGAWFLLI